MSANGQYTYVHAIRAALSNERLEAYGIGRPDNEKIANYLWNLALCESMYPALHGLEVALRNAVFRAGAEAFGAVATRDVPCWLDADPPLVHPADKPTLQAAKDRLRERGLPLEPGRLVAELRFGFWTSLFDVRYEQNKVLWPRLLSTRLLHPSSPRSTRSRKELSPLLNRMRLLRNRVFHHEPIWHWSNLVQQHTVALDLMGWFSPALRDRAGRPFPRSARGRACTVPAARALSDAGSIDRRDRRRVGVRISQADTPHANRIARFRTGRSGRDGWGVERSKDCREDVFGSASDLCHIRRKRFR